MDALSRDLLIQRAFRLEGVTVAWMLIETGVAIGAGLAAHSLLLLAFGIDSIIELISACVLVWRLVVELRHGRRFSEVAERRASRIAAALLFVLALYVLASGAWSLLQHRGAEFSIAGLILTVAAIPTMFALSREKLKVAARLKSSALRADAIESIACGWLSLVVVGGLVAQLTLGAWWIDPIASLAIVYFLIKEGREAWSGDPCCG